jgi:hypothetical protein
VYLEPHLIGVHVGWRYKYHERAPTANPIFVFVCDQFKIIFLSGFFVSMSIISIVHLPVFLLMLKQPVMTKDPKTTELVRIISHHLSTEAWSWHEVNNYMERSRLDDDIFEHRITLMFCEEFNMHYQLTAFCLDVFRMWLRHWYLILLHPLHVKSGEMYAGMKTKYHTMHTCTIQKMCSKTGNHNYIRERTWMGFHWKQCMS